MYIVTNISQNDKRKLIDNG